ncbi:MAG: hypothetical protein BGP09_25340 [Rhizobium sp. 60-20]|nr:MAG: hypothetical protein BGP09_25340 [Rhizobium sp. 60-20]
MAAGSAVAQQSDGNPPSVRSHVPSLKITLLSQLPKAPAPVSSPACGALTEQTSEGGKLAASLGWGVIDEQKFGPYEAVSFAGEFAPAASATCAIDKGNVALFRGAQLVALIYAPPKIQLPIGNISVVGDKLRIFDGDLAPAPVGDIRLMPDGAIEVDPIAKQESVCGGQAVVPAVRGKSIDRVRKALIGKGWSPIQAKIEDPEGDAQSIAPELRKHGVIEVESCSGTGLVYCSYEYRKGVVMLEVTSTGDGIFPTAADYSVNCNGKK